PAPTTELSPLSLHDALPISRVPNYDDGSLTENTRGAYPLDHIPGAVEGGVAGHPRTIFFLSADAFGVLPPIARLDAEQAMYYFLDRKSTRLNSSHVKISYAV